MSDLERLKVEQGHPVGAPLALHAQVMGQGPPLVVLHGLFGAGQNWQTIGRQRLAERYTLHLLDLRNHGQSPHADAHDYVSMAADVRHYIDAHIADARPHVMGHSMGGKVAMQLTLDTPDRVARLIVVDMAARAYAPSHLRLIDAMRAVDLSAARSRRDVEEALLPDIPDRSVRLFLLTNLTREGSSDAGSGEGMRWRVNLAAIHAHYDEIIGGLRLPSAAVQTPTLFVRGERSDFIRDDDWPQLLRLFSAARLQTIAGAGHWVHADAPEPLAAAIHAFLE